MFAQNNWFSCFQLHFIAEYLERDSFFCGEIGKVYANSNKLNALGKFKVSITKFARKHTSNINLTIAMLNKEFWG